MLVSFEIFKSKHLETVLPVHGFIVTFRCHYLRRKVIGCSTQSPSDIRHLLREPKVCDLEMTMPIQQQVLGFEISIDNVLRMQIVERQSDLCGVKFGYRVWKPLHPVSARTHRRYGTDSDTG